MNKAEETAVWPIPNDRFRKHHHGLSRDHLRVIMPEIDVNYNGNGPFRSVDRSFFYTIQSILYPLRSVELRFKNESAQNKNVTLYFAITTSHVMY